MKEQLQKALQELKDGNWYGFNPVINKVGTTENKPTGEVCTHTAIARHGQWKQVSRFFATVNDIPVDNFLGGIPAWNDSPERSKEQVIAAFEKAIRVATAYEGTPL